MDTIEPILSSYNTINEATKNKIKSYYNLFHYTNLHTNIIDIINIICISNKKEQIENLTDVCFLKFLIDNNLSESIINFCEGKTIKYLILIFSNCHISFLKNNIYSIMKFYFYICDNFDSDEFNINDFEALLSFMSTFKKIPESYLLEALPCESWKLFLAKKSRYHNVLLICIEKYFDYYGYEEISFNKYCKFSIMDVLIFSEINNNENIIEFIINNQSFIKLFYEKTQMHFIMGDKLKKAIFNNLPKDLPIKILIINSIYVYNFDKDELKKYLKVENLPYLIKNYSEIIIYNKYKKEILKEIFSIKYSEIHKDILRKICKDNLDQIKHDFKEFEQDINKIYTITDL